MERINNVVTQLIVTAKKYFLVVFVAIILGSGLTAYVSYQVMPIRTSKLTNVVLDVNGDDLLDFVVEMQVVINKENLVSSQQ
jgi:hypothetical protein